MLLVREVSQMNLNLAMSRVKSWCCVNQQGSWSTRYHEAQYALQQAVVDTEALVTVCRERRMSHQAH